MSSQPRKGRRASTGNSLQAVFDFDSIEMPTTHSLALPLPQPEHFNCESLFDQLMSVEALMTTFHTRFHKSAGKGIDRINGFQFAQKRLQDLVDASRKCIDGSFRFTPYREVLKPKGRNDRPRLISIPTIRDRVILHQLKDLLAAAFPECVPKNIAGSIVRRIASDLPKHDLETTFVAGCDIKKFYDTLHRDRLMNHLTKRLTDPRAIQLIEHSIVTPTVSLSTRRREYLSNRAVEGVPQGLATSNIMAAIYMAEIDDAMHKCPVKYFRYVDDVLIYGSQTEVVKAQKSFIARAQRRGLSVHKVGGGKSHLSRLSEGFKYLGYVFKGRDISVRPGSVENLLQSLAAKFSDFRHNGSRRLERFKYLNQERLNEIFLLELNERITGAVRDNHRYGWIAYFSQVTDHSLLHRLDSIVNGMFRRLPEFNHQAPDNLKRFARAYFEMKFRPEGGYVRNFNLITTQAEKMQFLVQRGRMAPTESLTDLQINDRFERYVNGVLRVMHADEARIY